MTKHSWSSSPISSFSKCSNPQPNHRRQVSIVGINEKPSSPTRFRYPLSPHKESSSNFWNKQEHYTWIDDNTPHKPPPKAGTSKAQANSTKLNRSKKAFFQIREQLALDLVHEIDEKVMGNRLSAGTVTTGGIKLEWSTRLRSAAGRAHWSRVKLRPVNVTEDQHNLKIELSSKIITDEGRLLKI
jgi:SprT-like family